MSGFLPPIGGAAPASGLAGEIQSRPATKSNAAASLADMPAASEDVTLSDMVGQVTALKNSATEF